MTHKIKTAVVTGQHAFDVPGFHALFRSIPEIDFYLQDLENFARDAGNVRDAYEVVVFYNFHRETPANRIKESLEEFGESQQGIFVLHHAILAFPQWGCGPRFAALGIVGSATTMARPCAWKLPTRRTQSLRGWGTGRWRMRPIPWRT